MLVPVPEHPTGECSTWRPPFLAGAGCAVKAPTGSLHLLLQGCVPPCSQKHWLASMGNKVFNSIDQMEKEKKGGEGMLKTSPPSRVAGQVPEAFIQEQLVLPQGETSGHQHPRPHRQQTLPCSGAVWCFCILFLCTSGFASTEHCSVRAQCSSESLLGLSWQPAARSRGKGPGDAGCWGQQGTRGTGHTAA